MHELIYWKLQSFPNLIDVIKGAMILETVFNLSLGRREEAAYVGLFSICMYDIYI
jgi:hypothetical protein